MPTIRFVSPERFWRAASLVMLAGVFAWRAVSYAGPHRAAMSVLGVLSAAALLVLTVPVLRAYFLATDEELIDRRAVRVVRVGWDRIAAFSVERPGGPWGGYCVVAECHDGSRVDFLSTRAYSRSWSARHLDELQRLCWTLEEHLITFRRGHPGGVR